jgi:hypothetical protein
MVIVYDEKASIEDIPFRDLMHYCYWAEGCGDVLSLCGLSANNDPPWLGSDDLSDVNCPRCREIREQELSEGEE